MARLLLVAALAALYVIGTSANRVTFSSGSDDTMRPGAQGADVVERTVEVIKTACVFDDDKMFLRRLAYVESIDGAKTGTYATGYDGGIWKVDENMFKQLKSAPMEIELNKYSNQFKSSLGIDWQTIVWADCRKPRVSALAARLFIQYHLDVNSKSMARDIPGQGVFWSQYYRPGREENDFVNDANKLQKGCELRVDLAFVLDGSGSVSNTNFDKMKKFAVDMVKAFDIGPNATQVSVMRYSNSATTEFYLNKYSNSVAMINKINSIRRQGGGTNSHEALRKLYQDVFTSKRGARTASSGIPKVAIFLTDGHSNSRTKTIAEALKVHDNDITMFAVGVGSGAAMAELEAIASDPECLYLFMLDGFNEVDSLKYAIEDGACNAPVIIGPGDSGTEVDAKVPGGGDTNCKVKVPTGGTTIKINAKAGAVKFFVSSNTYPSESYYDAAVQAVPGFPGVLYLAKPQTSAPEGIVFCNIKGDDKIDSDIDVGIIPGDKDYCRNVDCKNGGKCVDDLVQGYKCFCLSDFEGDHCEKLIDPCNAKPCVKGSCSSKADGTFTCTCNAGWTGTHCNEAIDKCSGTPCKHGNCTAIGNTYECCCEFGYTGANCDKEINECESNPCIHGVCDDQINKYVCICPPGYEGIHCEIDIDECASNPCVNGDCIDKVNAYKCICPPGWEGDQCEIDIDECASNPCLNGPCTDLVNGYICTCEAGWTGVHCEIDIDECASNPCLNGKCNNLVNKFKCICDSGWVGDLCDIDYDECHSSPCVHGDCVNEVNMYRCHCHAGYTGYNCEIPIDECASNPCHNGATCLDRIAHYICKCAPGFEGDHCEIEIDECEPKPCQHGTCKDLINDYHCTCNAGWTGKNCDCVIDNCENVPCIHGVCKNTIGGYTCTCNIGYTGSHCDNGDGDTGGGDTGKYDCRQKNPCTVENRLKGQYYFQHTNARKFVQCDAFGKCYVMTCAAGTVWDPVAVTCNHKFNTIII